MVSFQVYSLCIKQVLQADGQMTCAGHVQQPLPLYMTRQTPTRHFLKSDTIN